MRNRRRTRWPVVRRLGGGRRALEGGGPPGDGSGSRRPFALGMSDVDDETPSADVSPTQRFHGSACGIGGFHGDEPESSLSPVGIDREVDPSQRPLPQRRRSAPRLPPGCSRRGGSRRIGCGQVLQEGPAEGPPNAPGGPEERGPAEGGPPGPPSRLGGSG